MAPAGARATLAGVEEEWHARRVLKPLQPGPRCNGAGKLFSFQGSKDLVEDGGCGAIYDGGPELAARAVGHWPVVGHWQCGGDGVAVTGGTASSVLICRPFVKSTG